MVTLLTLMIGIVGNIHVALYYALDPLSLVLDLIVAVNLNVNINNSVVLFGATRLIIAQVITGKLRRLRKQFVIELAAEWLSVQFHHWLSINRKSLVFSFAPLR